MEWPIESHPESHKYFLICNQGMHLSVHFGLVEVKKEADLAGIPEEPVPRELDTLRGTLIQWIM